VGSSYGEVVTVFRITPTDEEGHTPGHGHIIENNLFRAAASTSGIDAIAAAFESFDNLGNIYRYNRFESIGTIIAFGDNNHGTHGVYLDNDTLVRITPTNNPKTVVVGWSNYFSSTNDTLGDIVYSGGASESDISFGASSSDYRIMCHLEIKVLGNNSLPVKDAIVTIKNSYDQTAYTDTTGSDGIATGLLSYTWEQNPGSDSTGYNPFTLKAKKEDDSTSGSYTVAWNNKDTTLVLANTAGLDDNYSIRGVRITGGRF